MNFFFFELVEYLSLLFWENSKEFFVRFLLCRVGGWKGGRWFGGFVGFLGGVRWVSELVLRVVWIIYWLGVFGELERGFCL